MKHRKHNFLDSFQTLLPTGKFSKLLQIISLLFSPVHLYFTPGNSRVNCTSVMLLSLGLYNRDDRSSPQNYSTESGQVRKGDYISQARRSPITIPVQRCERVILCNIVNTQLCPTLILTPCILDLYVCIRGFIHSQQFFFCGYYCCARNG